MTASLAVIQAWMQAVIQHPAGVIAGLSADAAQAQLSVTPDSLEEVLPGSSRLSSHERLQIYAHAYFTRLLEVMQSEFPTLLHYMGPDLFQTFASEYLHQFPSRSYTLSQLSAGFPDFLARTRPPRTTDLPDWADFLIDVATLERLYAEVFDGPGPERTTSIANDTVLTSLSPEDLLQTTLPVVPWVHLREFRFPVHDCTTSVRRGEPIPIPSPQPTWLLVTRRDYVVRRQPISHAEFTLLSALKSGLTVEAALVQLLATTESTGDLLSQMQNWFRQWTAAGYFVLPSTRP